MARQLEQLFPRCPALKNMKFLIAAVGFLCELPSALFQSPGELLEEGDKTKLREKITVLQADTDRLGLMPSQCSWYKKLVPGAPSCKDLGTPWEN